MVINVSMFTHTKVRLGTTTPDLAGTGGKLLRVTREELAKHNTKEDAWMALRGEGSLGFSFCKKI